MEFMEKYLSRPMLVLVKCDKLPILENVAVNRLVEAQEAAYRPVSEQERLVIATTAPPTDIPLHLRARPFRTLKIQTVTQASQPRLQQASYVHDSPDFDFCSVICTLPRV